MAALFLALFSISRAENEVAYTDLIAVNAYDTRAELLLGRRAWDFMDPAAVTDPSRFKQILYNYLSNAVKFTPGGGQVVARVIPQGDSATVSGVPAAFEPEAGAGNWLGAGADPAHRGSPRRPCGRSQRSRPGQGSVFSAVLPLAPVASSAQRRAVSQ